MAKKATANDKQERVTLKFTTGACAPARETVATMLAKYGPKNMVVASKNIMEDDKFVEQEVDVTVNKQAASWIEFLLLSSKRFIPREELYNPKNLEYAAKRTDMPKAWADSGCSKAEAFKNYKPKKSREKTKTKNKRKGSIVKTAKSIIDFLS